MLDEGSGLGRRKPVRRTPAERSAIVVETYDPGATVAWGRAQAWDCCVSFIPLAHGCEAQCRSR
jgi:hypothetical protein